MKFFKTKIFFFFFPALFMSAYFFVFSYLQIQAAESGSINATIKISVCGNSVIEGGEDCDGTSFGGTTCATYGFNGGGSLSCRSNCTFSFSACQNQTVSSGGGGGGGGGGGSSTVITPVATTVNFKGRAYPKSSVTLLKDAQVVTSSVAGADANFQISITNLSGGNYIFSLYSEDNKGNRSSLLTFPVSVTSGAITNVSGIFIAPTISVDKSEVKKGDNIAIFGSAAPNAEITISVNSDNEIFSKTKTDNNGVYLYNFDTSVLEIGQHFTKAKALAAGEISSFSKAVVFSVGNKNIVNQTSPAKGDLNGDQKVNLVDFSMSAYWYNRPNPPANVDLNSDGKVNLVDFSILAFSWTG